MMMQTCDGGVRGRGVSARGLGIVTVMVACSMSVGMASAQVSHDTGVVVKSMPTIKADRHGPRSYETLYLNSATSRSDAYDVVADLRNLLPWAKVFYVPRQRAISLYASAEDQALAKRILADVDRPVKSYKVTYTLTETGGGQVAKTRHVSMLVASGGSADVKQGERVPIATGSAGSGDKADTQFQYIDLGLAIHAKLSGGPEHLALDSRVEESGGAKEAMVAGIQEPVIEQTRLTGTSTLTEGKAVSLGSLDFPANGSVGEQHITAEVAVEPAS